MHQRAFRYLAIHMDDPPGNARGWRTEFCQSTAGKKKVEAFFAELKNQSDCVACASRALIRAGTILPGSRGPNIKRLVRFLSKPTTPVLPATT
jgi:hypothetical protein